MTSLDASDAIIFGSPTYMGGPAAQFKAFADATIVDKCAAGFTVSGALSGDKFSPLQYFHTLAVQHGMILVGLGEMPGQPNGLNRLGGWGGAMAQSTSESPAVSPNRDDLLTAETLGRRVATSAARMKG
jgi:NAD(P)H dehydrogenase (quinone)